MFGKRCSLCGGKLNSDMICTECGLDNTKSDKNYRINQSDCDHMPLTHVHDKDNGKNTMHVPKRKTESNKKSDKKSKERKKMPDDIFGENRPETDSSEKWGYRMNGQGSKKKFGQPDPETRKKKGLGIVIGVVIAVGVISTLYGTYKNEIKYMANYILKDAGFETPEDPVIRYLYAVREIPEEGESADYELGTGHYIVGFEIPEGVYTITPESETDSLDVDDSENQIYIYEENGEKMKDIRLYKGAVLTLECEKKMKLHTENAQETESVGMNAQMNPLTETITAKGEKTLTAGEDFKPGIYDMSLVSGGDVNVDIYDEDGDEEDYHCLTSDGLYGETFHYLVLPKDATIELEEDTRIKLVPTEKIESTDYQGFFEKF